jgi:hypothetical protein
MCRNRPWRGFRRLNSPIGETQRAIAFRTAGRRSRYGLFVKERAIRDLFLIFARIGNTAEGLLSFVQTYGPLTYYGNSQGELIDDLIIHAKGMQGLIDSISSHAQQPALEGNYDVAPGSTFNAVVVWDSIKKNYRWELRPSTLLDGLWLQLGEAITRGAQIGKCAHCGDWFETGGGTGRRAGAKFCSEDHKIAYHSLKRSRRK